MTEGGRFEVLFADRTMLVVNKPANVAMDAPALPHSANASPDGDSTDLAAARETVESWAYEFMKGQGLYSEEHAEQQQLGRRRKQLKFVHQLDYVTSGVLCLAFTKAKAALLAHCFEMRQCDKWYLAVLKGHISDANIKDSGVGAASGEGVVRPRGRGDRATAEAVLSSSCGETTTEGAEGVFVVKNWKRRFPDAYAQVQAELDEHSPARRLPDDRVGTHLPHLVRVFEGGYVERDAQPTSGQPALECLRSLQDIMATLAENDTCYEVVLPVGKDTRDPTGFLMTSPCPASATACDGTIRDARYAATCVHVLCEGFLTHPVTQQPVPITKVLLRPKSGRRHQLRVHCANGLGCPILGDVAYDTSDATAAAAVDQEGSTSPSALSGAAGWSRTYLHAWRLTFPGDLIHEDSLDEKARVEGKKKRKREVKGIGDTTPADNTETCRTVFQTLDPFPLPPDTMLNELYEPIEADDLAWSRPKLTALTTLVDSMVRGPLQPHAVLLHGPTGNGKLCSLEAVLRLFAARMAADEEQQEQQAQPLSPTRHHADAASSLSASQTEAASLPKGRNHPSKRKAVKSENIKVSLAESSERHRDLDPVPRGNPTDTGAASPPSCDHSPLSLSPSNVASRCQIHVLHSCQASPADYCRFLREITANCRGQSNAAALAMDEQGHRESTTVSSEKPLFSAYVVKFYGEPATHRLHQLTRIFIAEYEQLLREARSALFDEGLPQRLLSRATVDSPAEGERREAGGKVLTGAAAALLTRLRRNLVFFIHTTHDTHSDKMDLGTAFPREVLSSPALELFHCTPITVIAMQRRLNAVLDREARRRWKEGKLPLEAVIAPDTKARAATSAASGKAPRGRKSLSSGRVTSAVTAVPTGHALLAPEMVRTIAAASQGDIRQALLQVQWLILLPPEEPAEAKKRATAVASKYRSAQPFSTDERGGTAKDDASQRQEKEEVLMNTVKEIIARLTKQAGSLLRRSEADEGWLSSHDTARQAEAAEATEANKSGESAVPVDDNDDDVISISSDASSVEVGGQSDGGTSGRLAGTGTADRTTDCATNRKRKRSLLDLMESSLDDSASAVARDGGDDNDEGGPTSARRPREANKHRRRPGSLGAETGATGEGEMRTVVATVRDEYLGLSHATARLLTQKYALRDVIAVLNVVPRKLLSYLTNNLPSYFLPHQMSAYAECAAAGSDADAARAAEGGFSLQAGSQFRRNELEARISGHAGASNRTAGDEDATGMAEQQQLDLMALSVFDMAYRVSHPDVHVPRGFVAQRPPPFQKAAYPRIRSHELAPRAAFKRGRAGYGRDNDDEETGADILRRVGGEDLEEEFLARVERTELPWSNEADATLSAQAAGHSSCHRNRPSPSVTSFPRRISPEVKETPCDSNAGVGSSGPRSAAVVTLAVPPLPGEDMDILREGLPSYVDACGPLDSVLLDYAPFAQYIVLQRTPSQHPSLSSQQQRTGGSTPPPTTSVSSSRYTSQPSTQPQQWSAPAAQEDLTVRRESRTALSSSCSLLDLTPSSPCSLPSTQPPSSASAAPISAGPKRTVFKFTAHAPTATVTKDAASCTTRAPPAKRLCTELQYKLLRRGLPASTAVREDDFQLVSAEVAFLVRSGGAGQQDTATQCLESTSAAAREGRLLLPEGDTIEDFSD